MSTHQGVQKSMAVLTLILEELVLLETFMMGIIDNPDHFDDTDHTTNIFSSSDQTFLRDYDSDRLDS